MPLTLVHTTAPLPVVPPTPDTRDFQTNAQVQTAITIAANNASHALTGATTGDLLVASSPTAIGAISAPATGQVLTSNGVGVAPGWSTTLPTGSFPLLAPDGSIAAPSYAFSSEVGNGFYRAAAGITDWVAGGVDLLRFQKSGTSILLVMFGQASSIQIGNAADVQLTRVAAGILSLANAAGAIGSELKFDALPTIASGFGTSPSIVAGSTPFAGAVNVGTGGVATTGTINFNGTAFPNATPFVVVTTQLTNAVTRVSAVSATQMTFTSTTAWTASDIISWICVSAK